MPSSKELVLPRSRRSTRSKAPAKRSSLRKAASFDASQALQSQQLAANDQYNDFKQSQYQQAVQSYRGPSVMAMSEISLHDFNPRIHQIACGRGHTSTQHGCLQCLHLYEKLTTYLPIDPRIEPENLLADNRCNAWVKTPATTVEGTYILPQGDHCIQIACHYHELISQSIVDLDPTMNDFLQEMCPDGSLIVGDSIEEAKTLRICKSAPDLSETCSTLEFEESSEIITAPAREQTRTPSITRSMRDPFPFPLRTFSNETAASQMHEQRVRPTAPLLASDNSSSTTSMENRKPVKAATTEKREKSHIQSVSPIKQRKQGQKPAWCNTDKPSQQTMSPLKWKSTAPKRLQRLEEMVEELRSDYGNLKLHVEQQDQDRDMKDIFFGP